MSVFRIDPQLESDTRFLMDLDLCQVRILNDQRWPWIVLVPRLHQASELHELSPANQQQVSLETMICSACLKEVTKCTKINSGALGNIVRQLHIHVIARNEGDPNWPGPVWGFGSQELYDPDKLDSLATTLKPLILKRALQYGR